MKKFLLVLNCLIMVLGFSVSSSQKAEAVSNVDQNINGNEAEAVSDVDQNINGNEAEAVSDVDQNINGNEAEAVGDVDQNINDDEAEAVMEISPRINGNEATYTYWMEGSSSLSKTSTNNWVDRSPYTHGPITKTYTYETETSWSVEASGELSYNDIKGGLSTTFTSTKRVSNEISATIPKGKKGAYQTRDKFNHYNVKMVEWISIDGRKSKTGKTKTVSIKKKVGFEDRVNIIKG